MIYTEEMKNGDVTCITRVADDLTNFLTDLFDTKNTVLTGDEKNAKASAAYTSAANELIDFRDNVILDRS